MKNWLDIEPKVWTEPEWKHQQNWGVEGNTFDDTECIRALCVDCRQLIRSSSFLFCSHSLTMSSEWNSNRSWEIPQTHQPVSHQPPCLALYLSVWLPVGLSSSVQFDEALLVWSEKQSINTQQSKKINRFGFNKLFRPSLFRSMVLTKVFDSLCFRCPGASPAAACRPGQRAERLPGVCRRAAPQQLQPAKHHRPRPQPPSRVTPCHEHARPPPSSEPPAAGTPPPWWVLVECDSAACFHFDNQRKLMFKVKYYLKHVG